MVKGIGDYTAAAIASIAYNEKVSAIDGNVFRVLSRIYNIDTPINTGAGKTEFKNLSEKLIDDDNPGDYNQAVMEFGALQCKPKNPDCAICIFNTNCLAFQLDKVGELPVKKGKTKVRNRYFYYLMIDDGGYIYFNKRTQKDIWQNMYDFPLIELDTKRNVEEVIGSEKWNEIFSQGDIEIKSISKELVHQLSHQRIFIRFIHVLLKSEKFLNSNFIKIDKRNIFELAVPKVIDTYLLKMWA